MTKYPFWGRMNELAAGSRARRSAGARRRGTERAAWVIGRRRQQRGYLADRLVRQVQTKR
jgi:hypothetical protein